MNESIKICQSLFLWTNIAPPFICTIPSSLLERRHIKVSSNHISNLKLWISGGSSWSRHLGSNKPSYLPHVPNIQWWKRNRVATISHLEREKMEILQQSLIHGNSAVSMGLHGKGPLEWGVFFDWALVLFPRGASQFIVLHGSGRPLFSPPPLSSLATSEKSIEKYAIHCGSGCSLWKTGGYKVIFVSNRH